MGFGERINAAILKRVRSVVPAQDGAVFLASFLEAKRLVATMHNGLVGDVMVLLAEFIDGRVLRIDEHDAHWHAVLEVLDREGHTVLTSTYWTLQLIGDKSRTPIELLEPWAIAPASPP